MAYDHSATPLDDLPPPWELDPSDRVAPGFRVADLSVSELAQRRGIDNRIPDCRTLRALVHLTRQVLQPMCDAFGAFVPRSVYRCNALEGALKDQPASWISTSQHTAGCACDVKLVAVPTLELAIWANRNLAEFDQLVVECHDPRRGPHSGWVHVSLLPPGGGRNRREVLSQVTEPESGRLVVVPGLLTTDLGAADD